MNWVTRMNDVIDYIEKHLTEEINYSEVAKIACCSIYHFQRMFSSITEVSLAEYIRRRRLTLAAYELQNSPIKVVDLALKYGYDSPEAFTRAFHSLHGATPTAARARGTKLKDYPRMSFQISIKGVVEMNYRVEKLDAFQIVGVSEKVNMKEAFQVLPKRWELASKQGIFEALLDIRRENHPIRGILGVCADGDFGRNEEFDYILSIVSEKNPPDGMVKLNFPETAWVVFDVPGAPDGMQSAWQRFYADWLPTSAFELAFLPAIECYLPPEEQRNELWIPVVSKDK